MNLDTYLNTFYAVRIGGGGMKGYSSKDIISILKKDGWVQVNQVGSHKQFKHPTKKGKVTVAHPEKDVDINVVKSIERQSGLKF